MKKICGEGELQKEVANDALKNKENLKDHALWLPDFSPQADSFDGWVSSWTDKRQWEATKQKEEEKVLDYQHLFGQFHTEVVWLKWWRDLSIPIPAHSTVLKKAVLL